MSTKVWYVRAIHPDNGPIASHMLGHKRDIIEHLNNSEYVGVKVIRGVYDNELIH